MRTLVVDTPRLHQTPLPRVVIEDGTVTVEADDEFERRIRFTFEPYQAVRITTADCYVAPEGNVVEPQVLSEFAESDWLRELSAAAARIDITSSFMTKARHFFVPLQDDFLEVVAWEVKWSYVQDV